MIEYQAVWSFWSSVVGGVLSSLLAIVVIETYRWVRRRLTFRPLRRVLGTASRFGIISPSLPHSRGGNAELGLLTTDNAYALADVIESCRLIGATTINAPVSAIPIDFPEDQISLGGHVANELTGDYLSRYCPGFQPRGNVVVGLGDEDRLDAIYFECGGRTFTDTPDVAWSFIVKLGKDVTGQSRTIILLFGRSSFGTTQAAHILRARTSLISTAGDSSFVVAARTSRRQGYHSPPDSEIVDLTSAAFSE